MRDLRQADRGTTVNDALLLDALSGRRAPALIVTPSARAPAIRDVRRDPPRLVPGEWLGRGTLIAGLDALLNTPTKGKCIKD
jgi:hypothetical protein